MVTEHSYGPARRVAEARPRGVRPGLVAINADAALDGFSLGWSRFLTWYPAFGTVLLGVIYVVSHRAYYWILLEDHPIEWTQFAILVFACLTAVFASARFARAGSARFAVALAAAAVVCFGMAAEEISWGQRVFNLATPAALKSHNAQREITVHNMLIGGISFDKISDMTELTIALAGCVLALLTRLHRAPLGSTQLWNVAPPLATIPGFSLTALYWAFMLITDNPSSPAALYKQWAEICLYLGMLVTIACCYIRATPGRYVNTPTSAAVHRHLNRDVRVGRRPLIVATVAAFALMAVFAQLSAQSGVLPGNVPPSLVSLYGAV